MLVYPITFEPLKKEELYIKMAVNPKLISVKALQLKSPHFNPTLIASFQICIDGIMYIGKIAKIVSNCKYSSTYQHLTCFKAVFKQIPKLIMLKVVL